MSDMGRRNAMVIQDALPTDQIGTAASRVMFEHCSEGVLFSAPDGRISAANPAAAAMLSLSPEEICRLGHTGLFDQEDPRWKLGVAERDRTGSTVSVARLRRGDGRMIDVEVTSLLFADSDGSTHVCSILHDISGRTALEREMEELSARLLQLSRDDELTGLPNRRGLLVAGDRLLQFADTQASDVQVLFAGVDNVQELNDRIGHHAGDAALQAVARALSVAFGKNDVLARIGGTQFLALALNLRALDWAATTARIQRHLATADTVEFVGAEVRVSFGWTTRPAGDHASLGELVARSDWAMLEAREARNAAALRESQAVDLGL
jgi:diguanylate cyclase (GGDEF)-like protein/PAS domain S-box-containing protein